MYYVPTLPTPVIELDFLGLSIDEIRSYECHYPHGGEGAPITFCGQLVEHGSSLLPLSPQTMLPSDRAPA